MLSRVRVLVAEDDIQLLDFVSEVLTRLGADAMAATSVLDRTRVTSLVARLNREERKIAAQGLGLLARAAGQLKKRS